MASHSKSHQLFNFTSAFVYSILRLIHIRPKKVFRMPNGHIKDMQIGFLFILRRVDWKAVEMRDFSATAYDQQWILRGLRLVWERMISEIVQKVCSDGWEKNEFLLDSDGFRWCYEFGSGGLSRGGQLETWPDGFWVKPRKLCMHGICSRSSWWLHRSTKPSTKNSPKIPSNTKTHSQLARFYQLFFNFRLPKNRSTTSNLSSVEIQPRFSPLISGHVCAYRADKVGTSPRKQQ